MPIELSDMTRRDRNKLRNRREILEAALSVFAEKGYDRSSIQEIADRADFAVSTIYALFDGKEDLYRQVSSDVARRCGDIFDAAMERGVDEFEKLKNFARAKGRAARESPEGIRMLDNEMFGYLHGMSELPSNGIGRIYERFMLRIRDLFRSGIDKGLFVQADPTLLANSLDSITNALLQMSRANPDRYSYDDQIDDVLAIFFGNVLNNYRNPA